MRRATRFAIACGVLLAGTSAARAQVVIFGVADAGVRHVRNQDVGNITSLASGNNLTSRLGVRGVESLGGGLSAGFHLESTLATDTGTAGASAPAGQFWDRRATVSLISTTLGELRLGRDFQPSYSGWGRYDPFGYVGVASSGNLLSGTPAGPIRVAFSTGPNTLLRASNAVQWLSPSWGGVDVGLMAAAGEGGTAASGQNRLVGGRIGFALGGLQLSLATASIRNDLTAGEDLRDSVIGGAYDFGAAKVSAAVRRFSITSSKQTNALVAVVVPAGSGEVKASVQRVSFDGNVGATQIGGNKATQVGLGYVHNLSKRTALYGTLGQIRNTGGVAYAEPGGPAGLAAGKRSTGVEAGVRHSF